MAGRGPSRLAARGGAAMEANQRVTIWHVQQKRKIVGNAAPMVKNLQDYLDKHPGCEVYNGQDQPGEQKQEDVMDVRNAPQQRPAAPGGAQRNVLPRHSGDPNPNGAAIWRTDGAS